MELAKNFNDKDKFFIAEALDAIENSIPVPPHLQKDFNSYDNYIIWKKISVFVPGSGGGIPYANDTDAGANIVQLAIPGAPLLQDGYLFEAKILTTNTGATNLQINAQGLKSVVDTNGNPLTGGELVNAQIYLFAYDATDTSYQLLGLAKPSIPSPFRVGAGLESAEQINTLFPNISSGAYSIAEGEATKALAEGSHAEGINTQAGNGAVTGNGAHAEGDTTKALAPASHAEGSGTQATDQSAHAEGNQTLASGNASHAEGEKAIASGIGSHAEGNNTNAIGRDSHAEGISTTANSDYSHAEGNLSQTNGEASHAEGASTQANGTNSHAEGESTQANGIDSHAGGLSNIANGDYSSAVGGSFNTVNGVRSVILGGAGRTETDNNTTNVQELRVTKNVKITQGANLPIDVVVLDGSGTLTVNNSVVKAGAKIFLSYETPAGVNTILSAPIASIVDGVSFVINSSAGDTSSVNYFIINP